MCLQTTYGGAAATGISGPKMASRDPGVVGVRDLLDSASITRILDFLLVQRQRWQQIMEDVAKVSVKALF